MLLREFSILKKQETHKQKDAFCEEMGPWNGMKTPNGFQPIHPPG